METWGVESIVEGRGEMELGEVRFTFRHCFDDEAKSCRSNFQAATQPL